MSQILLPLLPTCTFPDPPPPDMPQQPRQHTCTPKHPHRTPLTRSSLSSCCRTSPTTSCPSFTLNSPGTAAASSSASAPATGCSSTTSGCSRYHAVATGDHLACSRPTPFTACASSSMHCGRDGVQQQQQQQQQHGVSYWVSCRAPTADEPRVPTTAT
jgi:hypothetical protein